MDDGARSVEAQGKFAATSTGSSAKTVVAVETCANDRAAPKAAEKLEHSLTFRYRARKVAVMTARLNIDGAVLVVIQGFVPGTQIL